MWYDWEQVCPGKTLALAEIHAMLAILALKCDCSVVSEEQSDGAVRHSHAHPSQRSKITRNASFTAALHV
jgi:cytochrome P450